MKGVGVGCGVSGLPGVGAEQLAEARDRVELRLDEDRVVVGRRHAVALGGKARLIIR